MTRDEIMLAALKRIANHYHDVSGGIFMVEIAENALVEIGEQTPEARDRHLQNLGLLGPALPPFAFAE